MTANANAANPTEIEEEQEEQEEKKNKKNNKSNEDEVSLALRLRREKLVGAAAIERRRRRAIE